MGVDTFSELSARRFEQIAEAQTGHRALLFPYINSDKDLPSPLVGLWLSNEVVKKQIEEAHYMPDDECRRVLMRSGAYLPGAVTVWLGLEVAMNDTQEVPRAKLYLPEDFIDNYQRFAFNKGGSFVEELQERFSVTITVS